MTTDIQKTLTGVTVGLSVSETAEMAALGVNTAEVTHMTKVITQHLMTQGVGIASERGPSCQGWICIGGRTTGAGGRYPNVIADALATLEEEQPLYLSGVIGGAAQQVIAALRQVSMPSDFAPSQSHDGLSPKEIWNRCKSVGIAGLARHNGLSVAENEALFKATNLSQISEAIVLGLSRLRSSDRL
jgi:hypothetical protein